MTDFNNAFETGDDSLLKSTKKWALICKISNIVLSILYTLCGWIFGFLGLMFFSLGFSEEPFVAICSFLASLLFALTPVFCVFGIAFSILLRKKKSFMASFMIQFLPFVTLGIALVSFFLSMIITQ